MITTSGYEPHQIVAEVQRFENKISRLSKSFSFYKIIKFPVSLSVIRTPCHSGNKEHVIGTRHKVTDQQPLCRLLKRDLAKGLTD
jgi:hypothetical protein